MLCQGLVVEVQMSDRIYSVLIVLAIMDLHCGSYGGRRSPAVACWASDHWVASSNPLRGKFRH